MSKTIGSLRRRDTYALKIKILLTKVGILDLKIASGSLELLPGLKTLYPPHHKPHAQPPHFRHLDDNKNKESQNRCIYLICSFFSLSINCFVITYRVDMKGSMD